MQVMYVVVLGVVGLTAWAVLSSCRVPLAYVADPLFCVLVVMLLWSYFACGTEPGAMPSPCRGRPPTHVVTS